MQLFDLAVGSLQASIKSDSTGGFFFTAVPEVYDMKAAKTGFLVDEMTKTVISGKKISVVVMLCPVLANNAAMAVLTWKALPKDLDLKISTPTGCLVSYRRKVCTISGGKMILDVDASKGYGPETVSFENVDTMGNGEFKLRVDQYSREGSLQASGASVRLLMGSNAKKIFNINEDGFIDGKTWHICHFRPGSKEIFPSNRTATT